MNYTENYSLLFTDTIFANLAISISQEVAFFAVKIFNNHNAYLVISVALCGYVIASILNYLFGKMCFNILSPLNKKEAALMYERVNQVRSLDYLPTILVLSAVPICGKFIVLFAGFCKINFKKTILISACAKLAYYIITYYI